MTAEPDRHDDGAPPPLSLCGPEGVRIAVAVPSTATTIGELADALGLSRRSHLLVDGTPVERRLPLERVDIVQGSRLTERPSCRGSGRGPSPSRPNPDAATRSAAAAAPPTCGVTVVAETGPAAGATAELAPGRHVIGRARSADVVIDDELVELHHAVADVDAGGRLAVTQLTGRLPCRVAAPADIAAAPAFEPIRGATTLEPGAVLAIGATRLRVRARRVEPAPPPAVLSALPGDPWRRTLHRTPRSLPSWDPVPIEPPIEVGSEAGSAGGLLAALLSIVGGVAVAVLMQNPLFLVFSAVGFFVAVGNRLGSRLSERRRRTQRAGEARRAHQRFAAQVAEQRAAFVAHVRAAAPTTDATLAAARRLDANVWCRRATHDDAFAVTLGRGTIDWSVALGPGPLGAEAEAVVRAAERLDDQPVVTSLAAGTSLAIAGAHAPAVARSLLIQLATWTGPADWRLVVVAGEPADWDWCAWLPQAAPAAGVRLPPGVVAADDPGVLADFLARLDGETRHVLIVTDRPELLANRTGALRRYVGSSESVSVLAVVGRGAAVPSMCRSLLEIGSLGQARWCPATSSATSSSSLHAAGIAPAEADDAARRLARLHDPEDPGEAAGATPASVSLSLLLRRCGQGAVDDPIAIAAAWRSGRGGERGGMSPPADGGPRAAIGLTADGVVEIDLVRDGPHALIAGTTGAGKSELLRTLVVSLAARSSPDDLTFVLIDYKGGSTFDACVELPHTVGMVTDLDDRLAERALVSLEAEIRRREVLLRDAGADQLEAYHASSPEEPLPRLVVIVDEFASLAADLPGFLSSLVGVAQRGRSLGIHLILATQRPAGVVSDEIRANTNLRIALRLQDRADAVDIVGDAEPSTFGRGSPGRAMMRLGPGETLVFQTAASSVAHETSSEDKARVLHRGGGRVGPSSVPEGPGRSTRPPSRTELGVLATSIRGAASLCDCRPPHRPWLEPLGESLGPEDLRLGDGTPPGDDAVGLVDDPARQRRLPLRWRRSDGNLALIGSLGSGTSTALTSVLVAAAGAQVYVIDGRGDGGLERVVRLAGGGAVVSVHDAERRTRLLRILAREVARRQAEPDPQRAPAAVLAVDGLSALHAALSNPGDLEDHGRLTRILADGAAVGVATVATVDRPAGIPGSLLSSFGQRWLFHLDDAADAAILGIRTTPPAVPGRVIVVGSGLEAQVAVLPLPPGRGSGSDPEAPQIGTLPEDVDAATLPATVGGADGATPLVLGLDFASLSPAVLDVPDGEHAVILGPARSGRSTALIRSIAAFRAAHPGGALIVRCPRRRSPVLGWLARNAPDAVVADDEAAVVAALGDRGDGDTVHGGDRVLIAIDDAERVDDANGALLDLVGARHPHVLVVVAGRPDALRSMYGHWTAVARRSRLGLVMTTGGDADGELLGEILPRRAAIGPRVGLAWMFDGGGRRLVQVARDRS